METLTLITNSLRSIGVLRAGVAPSAAQGEVALGNLNQLMASLAGDGIDLGYLPTTDITDDIALPLEDQATIQAMLALIEASERGIEPPAMVAYTAEQGRQRMLRNAFLLAQEPASLSSVSKGIGAYCGYDITTG